jgi:hypothetical protein
MPKKHAGITPEELTKLISRIKGLPTVEPKIITAQKAIADFKNVFRDALGKGYTIEQLVEIWCEHGSEIKPGTFLGYMREPKQTISIGESGKPAKRKRAPSHNSAVQFAKEEDAPAHDVVTPEMSMQAPAPETSALKANDEQADAPVKSKIEEDEDARVDELLAEREAATIARLGDVQSG